MRIYLVRHPETEWNREGRLQGHLDSPLTEAGRESARRMAKNLKFRNIGVIYSSDLGRCLETARILNGVLRVRILKRRSLRERDFGKLNGKPDRVVATVMRKLGRKGIPSGGESFDRMTVRVVSSVEKAARYRGKGNVLILTHDGAAGALISFLYGYPRTSKKCRLKDGEIMSFPASLCRSSQKVRKI